MVEGSGGVDVPKLRGRCGELHFFKNQNSLFDRR